jgi:hypothetical protein
LRILKSVKRVYWLNKNEYLIKRDTSLNQLTPSL